MSLKFLEPDGSFANPQVVKVPDGSISDDSNTVDLSNFLRAVITDPQEGQVIIYDGEEWVNGTSSGSGAEIPSFISTFAGYYPNALFPAAYTNNSVSGDNDLYTVPTGRKALVVDFMVTNSTVGSIGYYPELKISATYYRIGSTSTESAGGIGHNFGMLPNRSQPILLNTGETFAVNANDAGLTIWSNIIEFDDTSKLNRADLRTWTAGENTLFTVAANKTVSFGMPGLTVANLPTTQQTAICYVNGSGSSRTLSAIHIVPSAGATNVNNQFAGSNVIANGNAFGKFFYGNLNAGDSVVLITDANTAGQFAWLNYWEYTT